MEWTLISAVNNEELARKCLLSSPDIGSAAEVILQRGYGSAAEAYNNALQSCTSEVLVFAHQDAFLPEGWIASIERAVGLLVEKDPQWGVLGVWGVTAWGESAGHVYCAGLARTLGKAFEGVAEVRLLDEVVLVVRKSSGLRFDEGLPGFHMYGADICLEARSRGMKVYAMSAFCIHNTNGYNFLPVVFWKCCLFIRRKWKLALPVVTPCAVITRFGWPILKWNVIQLVLIALRRHRPGRRVADPAVLYRQLMDYPAARPGGAAEVISRPNV